MKNKPIFVSACLVGFPCRFDKEIKTNKKLLEMVKNGNAIPVCPELLGGCATPRPPREVVEKDGKTFVVTKNGRDVTKEHVLGAEETLKLCRLYEVDEMILKSKSPSCGCGEIFDGSYSGRLIKGDGITTRLLKKNGVKVKTEKELD